MRFEWDEEKAAGNWRKHGITFWLACKVFEDRLARRFPDEHHWEAERWILLGAADGLLLYVVFTETTVAGEHYVRIISARRATRHERRDFER